jgi:hypothetical protein
MKTIKFRSLSQTAMNIQKNEDFDAWILKSNSDDYSDYENVDVLEFTLHSDDYPNDENDEV